MSLICHGVYYRDRDVDLSELCCSIFGNTLSSIFLTQVFSDIGGHIQAPAVELCMAMTAVGQPYDNNNAAMICSAIPNFTKALAIHYEKMLKRSESSYSAKVRILSEIFFFFFFFWDLLASVVWNHLCFRFLTPTLNDFFFLPDCHPHPHTLFLQVACFILNLGLGQIYHLKHLSNYFYFY